MRAEAASVFNSLSTLKNLPHIPSQVMEIQRLIGDPNATPKQIAEAIKQDPIGAAQLLTTTENIRSNRNPGNPPVKSLEHAIVYLGLKAVKELILATAIKQFKFPRSDFDFEAFWHEAHLCGATAEFLNERLNLNLNVDEVYLAGSMCNLGKLVTAFSFPALATKIQHDVSSAEKPTNWRDAEDSYKFPDHRVLGEISASLWGFPIYITEACRRHHTALTMDSKFQIFEVAAIANQLVHWVLLDPTRMQADIFASFYKKTKLKEKDIEALIKPLSAINAELLKNSNRR